MMMIIRIEESARRTMRVARARKISIRDYGKMPLRVDLSGIFP